MAAIAGYRVSCRVQGVPVLGEVVQGGRGFGGVRLSLRLLAFSLLSITQALNCHAPPSTPPLVYFWCRVNRARAKSTHAVPARPLLIDRELEKISLNLYREMHHTFGHHHVHPSQTHCHLPLAFAVAYIQTAPLYRAAPHAPLVYRALTAKARYCVFPVTKVSKACFCSTL